MNYYAWMAFINGIIGIGIGFFVLSQERRNAVHKSFVFFSLSVGLWSIFYAVWMTRESHAEALLFARIMMVACYFIPSTFLLLVSRITRRAKDTRFVPFALFASSFFAFMNLSPWMIQDVKPKLFFPYWPDPGWLMHFCIFLFWMCILYTFGILFSAWRKAQGSERWQIRWVTITMLLAWLGGMTNWFLWYGIPIPPVSNFFVGVFFALLAYAVLRKGLFAVNELAGLIQEAKLSALGTLAASINHELRNPLYILHGLGRNFQEKSKEDGPNISVEEAREVIDRMTLQAERAQEIIRRFSDFVKRPRREESSGDVNLNAILDNVLFFLKYETAARTVTLKTELMSDLPRIQAADRDIEEILFNLITNACAVIQETGRPGQLWIRTRTANQNIQIEIEDNGPGMDKGELSRIFEPFHSRRKEGTGLGLFITKQLVERNGGRISVRSKKGEGTIFTMAFKMATAT